MKLIRPETFSVEKAFRRLAPETMKVQAPKTIGATAFYLEKHFLKMGTRNNEGPGFEKQ